MLILADAITYAKQQGATHIVDAATLTGAIGIALGQQVQLPEDGDDLFHRAHDRAPAPGRRLGR